MYFPTFMLLYLIFPQYHVYSLDAPPVSAEPETLLSWKFGLRVRCNSGTDECNGDDKLRTGVEEFTWCGIASRLPGRSAK